MRLSEDKCFQIHVSKTVSECHTTLKVHDKTMKKVKSAVYLADVVSESGTVDETVKLRELKSIGIVSQIDAILQNVSLGMFYFRTALILRDTMFLNGILTNAECWNFISLKNYKLLDSCDMRIFSTIFGTSDANRVLYFLESARIPIKFTIAKRRLMYLWHILTRSTDEIISKVYHIQKIKPVRYDWIKLVEEDKQIYNIQLSDEQIRSMSKNKFKCIVFKSVNEFAFSSLLDKARKQSKCTDIVRHLNADDISIQKYLTSDLLLREEQQLLFTFTVKILTGSSLGLPFLPRTRWFCQECKPMANCPDTSVITYVIQLLY